MYTLYTTRSEEGVTKDPHSFPRLENSGKHFNFRMIIVDRKWDTVHEKIHKIHTIEEIRSVVGKLRPWL